MDVTIDVDGDDIFDQVLDSLMRDAKRGSAWYNKKAKTRLIEIRDEINEAIGADAETPDPLPPRKNWLATLTVGGKELDRPTDR